MDRTPIERIEVKSVGRSYGRVLALQGVSLRVGSGEVLGIEGANGSGKSTLLGIIGTIIPLTAGEVEYQPEGRPLSAIRAEIGWVSHESLCYPDLTVVQNVELAARAQGVTAGAARRLVGERFGLGALANRRVRSLSRGQRQRVAFARALVHGPSVLLLDEPTTGLDAEGSSMVANVIREEAARGVAVVVVSHDAWLLESVCSRRVRLERGRLVLAGGSDGDDAS